MQISEGDCPETLPQNTEDAFSDWFRDQVTKGLVKNKCSSTHDYEDDINNHNHVGDVDVVDDDDDGEDEHLDIDDSEQVETGSNQSELHSSSSPDQVHQMSPNLPQVNVFFLCIFLVGIIYFDCFSIEVSFVILENL